MEPMDTEEGAVGISITDNPERKPATVTEDSSDAVDASSGGAAGYCAASENLEELHVDAASSDHRRGDFCG